MPPLVAAAVIGGISTVAGGAMAARGASGAARHQTQAANDAARLEADAIRYGADRTATSQAEQLAFLRQQAQIAQQQGEVDRRANYDQWANRERRLGSVGQALGFGGRSVPGYVPGVPQQFNEPTPVGSGRTEAAAGKAPTVGKLLSRSTINPVPMRGTLALPDPNDPRFRTQARY